jgi:hypothetical protein
MRVCTRFLQVVLMLFFFFLRARYIIITGGTGGRTTVSFGFKRQIEGIDRVKRQEAGSMGEGGGDPEE